MGVTPLQARARPPLVDGLFYPAEREALARKVDGLLARSPTPEGRCFAVISPHAGYEYAGEVMASAFRAVSRRSVRTAVIIGPVHRDPGEGFFLPESDIFSTPLGDIPVDTDAVAALAGCGPEFRRDDIPHLEEHCIEVQLPFLARVFPGASIVPILAGRAGAAALARGLRLTFPGLPDSIVLVVSANAASYMTGRDADAENAALESLIEACDWRGIAGAAERKRISPCGAAGIAAVLSLAGDGCRTEFLARASSRGRDEDPSRVVHYAAIGIHHGVRSH